MLRLMRILPLVLLPACALQPPAPPPAPTPQFIVPPGTEFVAGLFNFSPAVRVGPWITVSAVPGFDIEQRGFPDAYQDQVAAAFRNLKMVLAAAGATMDDVVEITTYQLDMEKFNDTVDGRNEAFGEHRPAWTAVGVSSMPLPSMQFQVSARALARQPVPAPETLPNPLDRVPDSELHIGARPPESRFGTRPGY